MQESVIEILYLHVNPGRAFCRTCLARLATAQQQSMGGRFAAITGKPHVEGMGRCSECGQYTQVLAGAAVIRFSGIVARLEPSERG
jgi:hypothetical protein